MKYANQLWQADTMFGPYLDTGVSHGPRKQAKLIAFIDDCSRVLCHGEFFFADNIANLRQHGAGNEAPSLTPAPGRSNDAAGTVVPPSG